MALSTRHTIYLTLFAVVLSGSAICGYLELKTLKEAIVPVEAETTYGPIKFTASLEKSTYKIGENVSITLGITNIGNKTITLTFSTPDKFDFGVCNESLQLIYTFSSTHGTIFVLTSAILEPGESLSQNLPWDQQKMKMVNGFYYGLEPVGPGTYFIFGKRQIWL